MKQMCKRIIAMLIAMSTLLTTMGTAFAAEPNGEGQTVNVEEANSQISVENVASYDSTNQVEEESREVLVNSDGYLLELVGYDYENDDAYIELVENGVVIASEYIQRSSGSVEEQTLNENNEVVIDHNAVLNSEGTSSSSVGEVSEPMATAYTKKGKIIYKLGGETTNRGVHVYYRTTYRDGIRKNLNGKYKTIAALAALICGELKVPATAANPIAGQVVHGLGIAAGVASIVIPNYYITVDRTTRWWKMKEMHNTSHEAIMKGRKYEVTKAPSSYTGKKTFTRGKYYRPSQFDNEDQKLAQAIFRHMFNNESWSVVSWDHESSTSTATVTN